MLHTISFISQSFNCGPRYPYIRTFLLLSFSLSSPGILLYKHHLACPYDINQHSSLTLSFKTHRHYSVLRTLYISQPNSFPYTCTTITVMERNQLHRQVAQMRQSFFDQGFLDEQFVQLEELQDDTNPNFVEEVATLFYRDSGRLLTNLEQAMERSPLDFVRLDNIMQQFKGSCSSIGAKRVRNECNQFKEYCRAGNSDGCMRTFQQLKREYATLKRKLESYFQLVRQVGPREMATRPR